MAQPVARALDPIGHGLGGAGKLLGGAAGLLKGALAGAKKLVSDASTLITAARVLSNFLLLIPPPLGVILRCAALIGVGYLAYRYGKPYARGKIGELAGSIAKAGRKGQMQFVRQTGVILPPCSPTVFAMGRPVARVTLDQVTCSRLGHSVNPLIEGSATVFVNRRPVVRVGDHALCGAEVTAGAQTVVIGGARMGANARLVEPNPIDRLNEQADTVIDQLEAVDRDTREDQEISRTIDTVAGVVSGFKASSNAAKSAVEAMQRIKFLKKKANTLRKEAAEMQVWANLEAYPLIAMGDANRAIRFAKYHKRQYEKHIQNMNEQIKIDLKKQAIKILNKNIRNFH